MNLSKAQLGLVVVGVVVVAELALVGVLASIGTPVPDQAWSLLYATVGTLAGVAGAQVWNGRMQKKGG